MWISYGRCVVLRSVVNSAPVNLLARMMAFLFQSVQYRKSSITVRANTWGTAPAPSNTIRLFFPSKSL